MVEIAGCVVDDSGLTHRIGIRDGKGARVSNVNHH